MRFGIIISFSLLVLGCERATSIDDVQFQSTEGHIKTNKQSYAWNALPSEAPLVILGNMKLTKGELINSISNNYFALVARGQSERQAQRQIEKSKVQIVENTISKFLYEKAFLLEAKNRGVVIDVKKVEKEWLFVSNYCAKANLSIDMFARRAGHQTISSFKSALEMNILLYDLFKVVFSNRLDVTDAEVDRFHSGLVARNLKSQATNKVYVAEMDDLRRKLISDKIEFSDDEDANAKLIPDGYHVECFNKAPANSFDDEELFTANLRYSALKVWSRSLESEDSISIYYFTAIDVKDADTPTLYSGFRVWRPKDLGYETPDKAKLKADLKRMRNLEIVVPEAERLQKKFGVLFPYGFVWQKMFDAK